jgi:hypothetical protein
MSDPHDHDGPDGCLCGHPQEEHEATPDHELPAAKGGVQGDRGPRKRRATRTSIEGEA